MRRILPVLCVLAIWLTVGGAEVESKTPRLADGLTDPQKARIENDEDSLRRMLSDLHSPNPDLLADVEVFELAAARAVHTERSLAPADIELVIKSLTRALERVSALGDHQAPWTT